MTQEVNKLTDDFVEKATAPGKYPDGNGLSLQITKTGSKSWIFRYKVRALRSEGAELKYFFKSREMGLGASGEVSLSQAREKAKEAQKAVLEGRDPLELKKSKEQAQKASAITFDECFAVFFAGYRKDLHNIKHVEQWIATIKKFASPVFGRVPVRDVTKKMVLEALEPAWATPETAHRLRGRIEKVLDYAIAWDFREGPNPAEWEGRLKLMIPKEKWKKTVSHHARLPYSEVENFCKQLRAKSSLTALALELLILTALRPGELVSATWEEFDLENKLWKIPGPRMKKKKEHRVPLSPRAVDILGQLKKLAISDFVFPGLKGGKKPMCTNSLLVFAKRMRPDIKITSHGFRSTFRDWAGDCMNFEKDVVEMALSHSVKNKVEAAYRRSDLLQKRGELMEAWASYCDGTLKPRLATVYEITPKPA